MTHNCPLETGLKGIGSLLGLSETPKPMCGGGGCTGKEGTERVGAGRAGAGNVYLSLEPRGYVTNVEPCILKKDASGGGIGSKNSSVQISYSNSVHSVLIFGPSIF